MLGILKVLPLAALVCAAEPAANTNAAFKPHTPQSRKIVTFLPGTSKEERNKLIAKIGGEVVKELPLVDGVVVELKNVGMTAVGMLKASSQVEFVEPDAYRIWIVQAPPALSAMMLPSAQAAFHMAQQKAPTSPLFAAGPKASASSYDIPWGVERVKAPAIWKHSIGEGVKVAVIDTGVDYTHPNLKDNYAGGYNALDPEQPPKDDHGHGTHVSGTICARPVDGEGIAGVAPGASLYAVKVLDANGGGSVSTIVDGIYWTVQNKMNVVNMSLGGPSSDVMEKAVKKAYEAGVTIVAASGNNPYASVSAPASYPETIAVSASDSGDAVAGFATTGPEVDFIAPGVEVTSTWPGGGTASLSGTSMASPHVAGMAVLAYSLGATSPASIKRALKQAAVPLDGLNGEQQGSGMVELDRWLE